MNKAGNYGNILTQCHCSALYQCCPSLGPWNKAQLAVAVTMTRSQITEEWTSSISVNISSCTAQPHILAAYHVLSLSFRISILLTYAMRYKEQRGHCGDRTKYFGLYFIGLGCDGVMIGLHPGLWRSDIGWHMDDKYETNMTTAMTAGSGQWGNWIRGCGRALREEGHINNGISGICVKLYKRNISDIFV